MTSSPLFRFPPLPIIVSYLIISSILISCDRSASTPPASSHVTTTTRIGVLAPLTGDVATYGTAILSGIELARSQLNAPDRQQFDLIVEDDQANPRVGVAAARKLISADHVPAIIGAVASSVTLSVAPIAEANTTVLLSPASSSPKITDAGDYIFRNYPSDTLEGTAAASFAHSNGWNRASVFVMNNDYGTGLSRVFSDQYRLLGGKIASSDVFNQDTADFRAALLTIKNASPDVLFIVGYGKELGTIARQAREIGITAQVLSTVNFQDPQTITVGGPAVEGAIYTSPAFDPSSENAHIRDFVADFTKRYGHAPDVWSAHGYDAMMLIGNACQSTPSPCTAANIRDYLYQVKNWPGVSGTTTFDRNGDVIKPTRFMTVHNRTFMPYSNP